MSVQFVCSGPNRGQNDRGDARQAIEFGRFVSLISPGSTHFVRLASRSVFWTPSLERVLEASVLRPKMSCNG